MIILVKPQAFIKVWICCSSPHKSQQTMTYLKIIILPPKDVTIQLLPFRIITPRMDSRSPHTKFIPRNRKAHTASNTFQQCNDDDEEDEGRRRPTTDDASQMGANRISTRFMSWADTQPSILGATALASCATVVVCAVAVSVPCELMFFGVGSASECWGGWGETSLLREVSEPWSERITTDKQTKHSINSHRIPI